MIQHDQTRPDGGAGQMFTAVAATPNRLSLKKTHVIPKGHVQLNSTELKPTQLNKTNGKPRTSRQSQSTDTFIPAGNAATAGVLLARINSVFGHPAGMLIYADSSPTKSAGRSDKGTITVSLNSRIPRNHCKSPRLCWNREFLRTPRF